MAVKPSSICGLMLSIYFVFELCNKQATLVNDVTWKSNLVLSSNKLKPFQFSQHANQYQTVLRPPKITHPSLALLRLWAAEAKFSFSMGGNLRINGSNTSASHVAARHRWRGTHTRDADRETIGSNILSLVHYNMLLQGSNVFNQLKPYSSST